MEECRPLKCDNRLKRRPLTPIRVFRGLICLLVFFFTAFMFLVYFAPIIAIILRMFSVHHCRKATSFLFGLWLALWPFLFEKINRTKMVFSGDIVPVEERVLLMANHRTEVDWMYVWDLALRKGCLGYIKYILKSSLMKLPVFGWGFHILEFISVERNWEIDEHVMRQMLSTFRNPNDPLWLTIFPEGTDFTYCLFPLYVLIPWACMFGLYVFPLYYTSLYLIKMILFLHWPNGSRMASNYRSSTYRSMGK